MATDLASKQFKNYQFYIIGSDKPGVGFSKLFSQFKHMESFPETNITYPDLIINFSYTKLGNDAIVRYPEVTKTGLVDVSNGLTTGRWAQTFFAQLSSVDFAPFTPFDLFYRSITGQHILPAAIKINENKRVYLDTKSLEPLGVNHQIIKELLSKKFQVDTQENSLNQHSEYGYYIGANSDIMKVLNYSGAEVIFFTNRPGDFVHAPPKHLFELSPKDPLILFEKIINKDYSEKMNEWISDSLEGVRYISKDENTSIHYFYRLFDFIIFNFVNSNVDVNITPKNVNEKDYIHLENSLSYLKKIHHLNLFALKNLDEFVSQVNSGNVTDQMITQLKDKIVEIDQLTENSIKHFGYLEFFNTFYKISKTSASGSNIVEISKSLILIYYEMNQVIEAYEEMIKKIVQGVNNGHKQVGNA